MLRRSDSFGKQSEIPHIPQRPLKGELFTGKTATYKLSTHTNTNTHTRAHQVQVHIYLYTCIIIQCTSADACAVANLLKFHKLLIFSTLQDVKVIAMQKQIHNVWCINTMYNYMSICTSKTMSLTQPPSHPHCYPSHPHRHPLTPPPQCMRRGGGLQTGPASLPIGLG